MPLPDRVVGHAAVTAPAANLSRGVVCERKRTLAYRWGKPGGVVTGGGEIGKGGGAGMLG